MRFLGEYVEFQQANFRSDVYFDQVVIIEKTLRMLEYGYATYVDVSSIQDSGTTFNSNDTSLVTAAAMVARITAMTSEFGYGDLTSIVAGTGLSGTSLTGPIPTLNVDAAQTGITSLGTLNSLAVSAEVELGSAAMTLTNQDVDQIALDINADNTIAAVIDITATDHVGDGMIKIDSANSSSEIFIDKDITATGTIAGRGMIQVDSLKASNTEGSETADVVGIKSTVSDTGTNDGTSNITNLHLTSNMTNDDGVTSLIGISNTLTGESDNTIGYYSNVVNGSPDFKLVSSTDVNDYFTIATGASGATTLTTVDNGSEAADLSFAINGGFIIESTTINISEGGAITGATWEGTDVGVANGGTGVSTLGADAVLIGNGTSAITSSTNLTFDDTDLSLAGAGKMEFRGTGSYINSPDTNDIEIVATDITLDAAAGISLEIGDDENINLKNGSNIFGFFHAEDGSGSEFKLYERGGSTDADYFHIVTTEHGATLLNTWDNSGTAAHFEIDADGDITLDAAGTIKLEGPVRPTGQIWIKNVGFVDEMGTNEHFTPMVGAAENPSNANAAMGLLMPVGGKLLKVHVKSNKDHSASSNQMTIKLVNWDADEAHSGSTDSILSSVTQTGPADTAVGVFDFTGTKDSGIGAETNAFTAGEIVAIGIKNSVAISAGNDSKYFLTLVFELDWSGY